MNHNQAVGEYGEVLAVKFLEQRGFKVLEKNLKASFKELDVIALDGKTLVFVEVKTRTTFRYGGANDAMSDRKLRNLRQAAMTYLYKSKKHYSSLRFDFVAVDIDNFKKTANIKHYKDIL